MNTENNKLILEFLNVKKSGDEYDLYGHLDFIEDGVDGQHFFTLEQMKFHNSWDWLMPLVLLAKDRQFFGSQRLIDNIDKTLLKVDLLATYKNLIDFIEYYNLNK